MSEYSQPDSSKELDIEELAMQIISHAGEGKHKVRTAIEAFGEGDDIAYTNLMDEAEKEFVKAHRVQITYLQQQAVKQDANTPILLIHAMDILMNAMNERELVMMLIKAVQTRGILK